MKAMLIIISLLFSQLANSREMPPMDNPDLQDMMQNLQQIQQCFKNVSESQLQQLEQRARQFQHEARSLCQSGKRSQAQKLAINFSQQMLNDPVVKTFKQCGAMIQQILPDISMLDDDFNPDTEHVCDTNLDIH